MSDDKALRLAEDLERRYNSAHVSDLDAAIELRRLHEEVERLRAMLQRIRQWDMLGASADGAFWKREIDAALKEGQR